MVMAKPPHRVLSAMPGNTHNTSVSTAMTGSVNQLDTMVFRNECVYTGI